jgi:hypothetical protein
LPELVAQAQQEAIGLTDEEGNLIGLLAGVDDESFDQLLVRKPGFQEMVARSRASLRTGAPVSVEQLLEEARSVLAEEQKAPP